MKIKALKSFSGKVTLKQGEERDVNNDIAKDLIAAGYAQALKPASPPEDKPDGNAPKKQSKSK